MSNPTLGGKFGRDFNRWSPGQGNFIRQYPKAVTAKWRDFAGGYNVSDEDEDVPQNASPSFLDMETDRKDRLRKAPGTEQVEALTRSAKQIALHATLGERSALVLFDAPYIGIKREAETVWTDVTLPTSNRQFFWTTFGESFVFGNGDGFMQVIDHEDAPVAEIPYSSNGVTAMSMAGRLFVGGAVINGQTEPLGVSWTGVNGYNDWTDPTYGTGSELLIGNQTYGDRIVAMRAMGFDFAAILCRHSVWIGTRTEQLFRPLDFQPRVTGKGCVEELTAQTAVGGVVYLSDEGVELFNGTDSQHISASIDSELVPLIRGNIKFSSAYNAVTQRYYLFAGTVTYVLDMLRGRWYKRNLEALGGVPFARQYHAEAWDETEDLWDARGDMTWRDTAPTEDQVPDMVFLGTTLLGVELHKESQSSFTNFGVPFIPRWRSGLQTGDKSVMLFTTKEIRLSYQGSGTVQYGLPDNDSDYQTIGPGVALSIAGAPRISRSYGVRTGKGVGIQVEILSGDPLMGSLELDILPRGVRIETSAPSTFNPADFTTGVKLMQLPPTYHKPDGGVEFVLQGKIFSSGAGTQVVPDATKVVPPGCTAVIRSVTVYADDTTQQTDLRWALRRSGAAVAGYDSLRLFPRDSSANNGAVQATVTFAAGETIDLTVQNIDGGDYLVGAEIYGWYWPNA